MQERILGRDLKVSSIGLGCMGMTHAYGAPADRHEMIRLMEQAIDLGCTFFDTAECYTGTNPDGSTAWNEELVGDALRPYRNHVIIATKFGVRHTPDGFAMDSRPETIRRSIEGSLRRLGIDCIDLYYLHRIDPKVPVEEVAQVMQQLIDEGKIRHWGMSEADEASIRRAHAVCPLTAIQNRYSMLSRDYEALFPALEELHIGFVAFSPLANGFLSDRYDQNSRFAPVVDFRSRMPQFTEQGMRQNRDLLALVRATAEQKHATPAQLSLAWMLAKRPWIVPIPGTRKSHRLAENAGAANIRLTPAEVAALDAELDRLPDTAVFGGTKFARN